MTPAPNASVPVRVAIVGGDDTHTVFEMRERRIPGHVLDVVGGDVAGALTAGRYDLVHIHTPGPAGLAAAHIAGAIGLPVVASCPAGPDPHAEALATLRAFYDRCEAILSRSRTADFALLELGISPHRIVRWAPGVDLECFHPARYAAHILPAAFNVLYAGRLSREQGLDLLAEAFLVAHDRDPRLHLVLAGGGPDEYALRGRLGRAATFLGPLDPDDLARVYASADLFVCPSSTDAVGQTVLEAQASGVPVLAVDAGSSAELIENGRSGCLVSPEPEAMAAAIRGLARREALRDRLATGGLLAVRGHSLEQSTAQLAAGYARALHPLAHDEVARAA